MSGKRAKIRVLDSREDLNGMFAEQGVVDPSAALEGDGENAFSQMLEESLSGVDQAEIIRQKYPEPDAADPEKNHTRPHGSPRAELDLHGCHVQEAMLRVEGFIETAARQGLSPVRIIVGKGLHSQGPAVLPDAVAERIVELKSKGRVSTFRWETKHKRISGSLLVYLQ